MEDRNASRVDGCITRRGCASSGSALAQQQPIDWSKVEIKTTDLGNKTYMLVGQGGNITVAVGSDAIIMVDGQYAPLHDKIKAAITAIGYHKVKFLIDTHFHPDHTGGNEFFAKNGAVVVADVHVKTRMAAGTTNGLTGVRTLPARGVSTMVWASVAERPTSVHCAISDLTKAPKSAGVLLIASAPSLTSRCLISGVASSVFASACMRVMIAAGVPAGANMPNQFSTS